MVADAPTSVFTINADNVTVKKQALALSERLYSDNKKQVEIGTLAPISIVQAEANMAGEIAKAELAASYAKSGLPTPEQLRAHWQAFINQYFEIRQSLAGLVVVMDIRHPLKDYDRQMLGYAVERGLPAHVLAVELLRQRPDLVAGFDDEALARLVPRAYREYFPGKDACVNGHFYLHDGSAWSFFKAGLLDE